MHLEQTWDAIFRVDCLHNEKPALNFTEGTFSPHYQTQTQMESTAPSLKPEPYSRMTWDEICTELTHVTKNKRTPRVRERITTRIEVELDLPGKHLDATISSARKKESI